MAVPREGHENIRYRQQYNGSHALPLRYSTTAMKVLKEIAGPPHKADTPQSWIFDRLDEWAKQSPRRLAFSVDHSDRVEQYYYSDVVVLTHKLGAALLDCGVSRGD